MSKNMSSTNRRYEAANKKFDEAINKYNADVETATSDYQKVFNKYAGDAGLESATNYAQNQASQQSLRAGTQAGATANRSARTAGLNKAQAAMLAQQAASDTTGNTYQSAYDSSRNAALNNNQTTLSAKQGEYSTRVNAAATPLNARGQQLTAAQQEGQNAYNRAWGNVGGAGSMVTGLLTSDERLKEAVNVSSADANTEDYECFKCNIGARRTSLADIATELYNFGNDIRILHLYAAGKNFMEYHKKLNELYDEVFKAYDEIAELAISKGEKVPNPSSHSAFSSYKPLDPADYSSEQISQEVLNRGNKVLDTLKNHKDYEGFVVSKLDDITGKLDKLINYIFKRSAIDLSTSIASDERLKTFREVSKSLNTNPKTSSYNLLKVTYKHSKGE